MQAWDKLLDEKQIAQLYLYVRARADKVLPPGRPDEVGPEWWCLGSAGALAEEISHERSR